MIFKIFLSALTFIESIINSLHKQKKQGTARPIIMQLEALQD